MTPEQIAAIAALLKSASAWPLWMVALLIIVGPWIAMGSVMRLVERGQSKRHEEVVHMYESNVVLVEVYQALTKNYEGVARDYKDLVALTTQVVTELKDMVKYNLYCPMVRRETKPREEPRG